MAMESKDGGIQMFTGDVISTTPSKDDLQEKSNQQDISADTTSDNDVAENTPQVMLKSSEGDPLYSVLVVIGAALLLAAVTVARGIYAVLLVELTHGLDTTKAGAGLSGSIHNSLQNFCGIFMGVLVDVVGVRHTALLSAVFLAGGVALSSLAPDIYVLSLTYGVIAGIGSGGAWLSAIVAVQRHFVKRRASAMAIAMTACSVTMLLGVPGFQLLANYYGWRGAMLIAGALMLNAVPGALIFHPKQRTKTQPNAIHKHRPSNGEQQLDAESSTSKVDKPTLRERICQDLFRFALLTDGVFVLYLINRMSVTVGSTVMMYHSPGRAVSDGWPKMHAAILPSVIGGAVFIARLPLIAVVDKPCLNRTLFYSVSTIACGLTIIVSCFFDDLIGTFVLCAAFGVTFGFLRTVSDTVLVDLIGAAQAAAGEGWALTLSGALDLLILPFTGWLFDVTNNYDVPFYVAGGVVSTGGLCGFFIFLFFRHRTWTDSSSETQSNDT